MNGPTYVDERVLLHDAASGDEYYYALKVLYTDAGLLNELGQPSEVNHYDAYGRVNRVERIWFTGDFDRDGDVDLSDFANFSLCFGGANNPPASSCPPGIDADFDDDNEVDLSDFSAFSLAFTGSGGVSDDYSYAEAATDNASELGNVYNFTGRRLDRFTAYMQDRQVYHYRARAYDPEHGRFLQRDPREYDAGMNLYEYVKSNPTILADPTGECPFPQPGEVRWSSAVLTFDNRYFTDQYLAAGFGISVQVAPRFLQDPCCPQIRIVQIVRKDFNHKGFNEWKIDNRLLKDTKPWYGETGDDPNPVAATSIAADDNPGYQPSFLSRKLYWPNFSFIHEFEMCVVCAKPKSSPLAEGSFVTCVLSCVTWSYEYTQLLGGTPPHLLQFEAMGVSSRPAPPARGLMHAVPVNGGVPPSNDFKKLIERYTVDLSR